MSTIAQSDFKKALDVGRPPNIKSLFPNSKALIVSGKFMDVIRSRPLWTVVSHPKTTFKMPKPAA